MPTLNVVLFQPEIPQNTGNIGRTCVALNAKLWIVKPTGFRMDEKQLLRAGLDYWQHLQWEAVDSWDHLLPVMDQTRAWFFTKFATRSYSTIAYQEGDWLVFGKESVGLSKEVLSKFENHLTIPMSNLIRSYNIANSVAFVVGEAKRQIQLK